MATVTLSGFAELDAALAELSKAAGKGVAFDITGVKEMEGRRQFLEISGTARADE
tara:strand:+ start:2145 stop:2309 length:165 start_codon:yes stop_codon:yes gene_type:complete